MSVFRDKKTNNFTVMSNHHLQNKELLTSGVNHQKESVSVDQKESGRDDHFQPI